MEQVQQRIDKFNRELEAIPAIKRLAAQAGVPPAAVVALPVVLLVFLIAFGIGASFLTRLIGIAYPTFKSVLALATPSAEDDKQWLTYWAIFGFFSVLDEFGCCILSYIPYYYFIKVCLLIWLFNPVSQGAMIVYANGVKPFMTKYNKQINEFVDLLREIV